MNGAALSIAPVFQTCLDNFATDQFDPLEFEPKLKLGGRMPHFWLDDKDGRYFSVLDLPSLMIGSDRLPCYVMLVAGEGIRLPKSLT